MRNNKKYLAALLAGTMVLGSSATVFASGTTTTPSYVSSSNTTVTDSDAASGTINGTGGMEGTAAMDVFHVEVPTVMVDGSAENAAFNGFNFVLDPEGLITATEASRYKASGTNVADAFDPDKTLYFINKTDRKLTDTSDILKVTNKSSMAVNITLDAEVTGLTDIKMTADKTFENDDTTSLYLALKDTKETPIVSNNDETTPQNLASVSTKIEKAPTDAYEIKENGGVYEYTLVDDDAAFATYEFALTGACNANADWKNISGEAPAVAVTWTIEAYEESAPSIATKTYTYTSGQDVEITVDLGAGDLAATGIKSVSFVNGNGKSVDLADADYTFSGTTLTIKDAKLATVTGTAFTITFDDAKATPVSVTINR